MVTRDGDDFLWSGAAVVLETRNTVVAAFNARSRMSRDSPNKFSISVDGDGGETVNDYYD